MAATLAGRQLTEANRLGQSRLAAGIVRRILATWGLIDPENLDASVERWLAVVTPLIEAQFDLSARLAANYLTAYRTVELGGSTWTPTLAAPPAVEAITTSMLVTGPVSLRSSLRKGESLAKALTTAKAKSSGAAVRHVLAGSRNTITTSIEKDPKSVGYARATSAKPCAFCAMLAGRGYVYRSSETADFKPHDACHCQPEPAYDLRAPLPPGAQQFSDLWETSTRDHSGKDAVNAFRRAYEAPANPDE